MKTTLYPFNDIANPLTEEEFEIKETSTVSIHRCSLKPYLLVLLQMIVSLKYICT